MGLSLDGSLSFCLVLPWWWWLVVVEVVVGGCGSGGQLGPVVSRGAGLLIA